MLAARQMPPRGQWVPILCRYDPSARVSAGRDSFDMVSPDYVSTHEHLRRQSGGRPRTALHPLG
jgi:hypothetical protein